MSGRTIFMSLGAVVMAALFVLAVVIPGLARGGWAEVVGVMAVIGAILVGERLLRGVGR